LQEQEEAEIIVQHAFDKYLAHCKKHTENEFSVSLGKWFICGTILQSPLQLVSVDLKALVNACL
jgi:hypothetical protein